MNFSIVNLLVGVFITIQAMLYAFYGIYVWATIFFILGFMNLAMFVVAQKRR